MGLQGAQADREWPKYEHFRSSLFRSEIKDLDQKMRLAFEKANTELNMTSDTFLEQMSIPPTCYDVLYLKNRLQLLQF